jgi:hypothetical protein
MHLYAWPFPREGRCLGWLRVSCSHAQRVPHPWGAIRPREDGSPTLQTLQEPILLLPWVCFPNPKPVRASHHQLPHLCRMGAMRACRWPGRQRPPSP